MLLRACKNEGFTPKIAIYSNDLLCYNKYIEAGIGIGVGRVDSSENVNSQLQRLDVIDFVERQTIYVFYKDTSPNKIIDDFVRFLKSKS